LPDKKGHCGKLKEKVLFQGVDCRRKKGKGDEKKKFEKIERDQTMSWGRKNRYDEKGGGWGGKGDLREQRGKKKKKQKKGGR